MIFFRHNAKVNSAVRLPSILLSLMFVLPVGTAARTKPKGVTTKLRTPLDGDYVSALSVANRFLSAWQSRDHETVLLLLTDSAKQHTTEDRLGAFFSGNGGQSAFLITTGRKIGPGRFDFPVALMESAGNSVHRRYSHIVVIRAGKDEWAVDTLP